MDKQSKFETIKKYVSTFNAILDKKDECFINEIYDIYINKNFNNENPLIYRFIGNELIFNKKYDMAAKYYLKGIANGDVICFSNLGALNYNLEKYMLAEIYYLLAYEKGYIDVSKNLGLLYFKQDKLKLAEKYYLIAAKHNPDYCVLYNLSLIYKFLYDENNSKKYLELANKC